MHIKKLDENIYYIGYLYTIYINSFCKRTVQPYLFLKILSILIVNNKLTLIPTNKNKLTIILLLKIIYLREYNCLTNHLY